MCAIAARIVDARDEVTKNNGIVLACRLTTTFFSLARMMINATRRVRPRNRKNSAPVEIAWCAIAEMAEWNNFLATFSAP